MSEPAPPANRRSFLAFGCLMVTAIPTTLGAVALYQMATDDGARNRAAAANRIQGPPADLSRAGVTEWEVPDSSFEITEGLVEIWFDGVSGHEDGPGQDRLPLCRLHVTAGGFGVNRGEVDVLLGRSLDDERAPLPLELRGLDALAGGPVPAFKPSQQPLLIVLEVVEPVEEPLGREIRLRVREAVYPDYEGYADLMKATDLVLGVVVFGGVLALIALAAAAIRDGARDQRTS